MFQLEARDWNRLAFGSGLRELILDGSNIRNVDFRGTNIEKMSLKRTYHDPEDWLTIMFPESLRYHRSCYFVADVITNENLLKSARIKLVGKCSLLIQKQSKSRKSTHTTSV